MVFVRGYPRRRVPHLVSIREPFPSGRKLALEARLNRIVDEVISGRRAGYSWTGGWKFDIDDPSDMERIYNKLRSRTMYVIATTNRTLQEWGKNPHVRIGANYGVGIWRAGDGTVFVDDIIVLHDIGDQRAIEFARQHKQLSILKVDGRTRIHAFIDVPLIPEDDD